MPGCSVAETISFKSCFYCWLVRILLKNTIYSPIFNNSTTLAKTPWDTFGNWARYGVPILWPSLELQKSWKSSVETIYIVPLSPKQCWLWWKRLECLTFNIAPGGGEREEKSFSRDFALVSQEFWPGLGLMSVSYVEENWLSSCYKYR